MTPEQIEAVADEIDNNSYSVIVKDQWVNIELTFTVQVNMPYKYWMDMQTFWAGHECHLEEANNDVIKSVLLNYGKEIVGFLLGYPYASLEDVNRHIGQLEGYIGGEDSKNFKVTKFYFDFDYELKINYEKNCSIKITPVK